ncbi:MAG: VWA domain-containing protein, partial [Burkholderiales bacterium]
EHRRVFDHAFDLFWRAPATGEKSIVEIERWRRGDHDDDDNESSADKQSVSVLGEDIAPDDDDEPGEHRSADQRASASTLETLGEKHFDQMDTAELAAAKRAIRDFEVDLEPIITRRRQRDPNGRKLDWRRSLRLMQRGGGAMTEFAYYSRREERPAIVLLCDISGSMQLYSRLLLYFACALGAKRRNTHAFLFGTQLTNISRLLVAKDIGPAVDTICATTRDFDGGTRIGASIAEFNKRWSRRLLARKSIVVLMTDGLDGEDTSELDAALGRLRRSASRVMWLNPLMRFPGFSPEAAGVKVLAKHADSMHGVHTLRHIGDVVAALREPLREH